MKLVLITPPSPWLISDRDQPFLGALYIHSYLKDKGHDVQFCDLAGMPEEYWYIPVGDVYGITGTTPHFPYMKKIIAKLKEREPHKPVIVGGVHASVLPMHTLSDTKANVCIIGEGEEVMESIMRGEHDIGGGSSIVLEGKVNKDLDALPLLDRSVIDYYDYLIPRTYKYIDNKRDASILTGRGCPYKCAFCASNKLNSGKVRLRSSKNVIAELVSLKNRYDIGMCNFVDDTFILNKNRVREICDGIADLDIKWYFLTRVDHVDGELFKYMHNSGCSSVTFGFESGSNRMLREMKKNTTVDQAYWAIRVSSDAGLKIRGQLMIGFPGETDESIEETAEFIRTAKDVTKFGLHVFQPFPGCDVWENPVEYDYVISNMDFGSYHTIGRPKFDLSHDKKVNQWFKYLKEVISERDIENE